MLVADGTPFYRMNAGEIVEWDTRRYFLRYLDGINVQNPSPSHLPHRAIAKEAWWNNDGIATKILFVRAVPVTSELLHDPYSLLMITV